MDIVLTNGQHAKVDSRFAYLKKYKWRLHKGYPVHDFYERGDRKTTAMHRLVIETPDGKVTDHINGDKLDNRRANLRVCSQRNNCRNRGAQSNNRSGYKGVSWNRTLSKWVAQISINGKQTYLGLFENIEEAAHKYDEVATKHHGEFAWLNFARRE